MIDPVLLLIGATWAWLVIGDWVVKRANEHYEAAIDMDPDEWVEFMFILAWPLFVLSIGWDILKQKFGK